MRGWASLVAGGYTDKDNPPTRGLVVTTTRMVVLVLGFHSKDNSGGLWGLRKGSHGCKFVVGILVRIKAPISTTK